MCAGADIGNEISCALVVTALTISHVPKLLTGTAGSCGLAFRQDSESLVQRAIECHVVGKKYHHSSVTKVSEMHLEVHGYLGGQNDRVDGGIKRSLGGSRPGEFLESNSQPA